MPNPKIVLLGGGTGSFTLLQGLKKLTSNITAVVNMSDDGGSTGLLRDELGVLPPGDIRQCLVALSETPDVRDLFSYRFSKGSFRGQSLGNIILSGLELQYGNFEKAVEVASELLRVQGAVIPVTLLPNRLFMRDGRRIIRGEGRISNHFIKHESVRLWLEPSSKLNPAADKAIRAADMVVIAPGNFYGSLMPILLTEGIPEALRRTKAAVVFVTNLVNKPGQCDGWHVADYVEQIEKYLGRDSLDVVLYNTQPISPTLLKRYAVEGEFPVEIEPARLNKLRAKTIGIRLVAKEIARQDPADEAIRRTLIRHDAEAVCVQLTKLLV